MMVKDNDLIYGVYDKTRGIGGCDDYFGYFKKEKDAKNEMKIQFEHLKSKNPKETFNEPRPSYNPDDKGMRGLKICAKFELENE